MNQLCKVCGEPAAGYHFGAFTCEGCKSFFGRTYNNLSALGECKNNGECIINKKNRTSCKSCRLKKCLMVGMSKSGSRYGRRSNWFKIHCLIQDQQEMAARMSAENAAAVATGGVGAGKPQQPGSPASSSEDTYASLAKMQSSKDFLQKYSETDLRNVAALSHHHRSTAPQLSPRLAASASPNSSSEGSVGRHSGSSPYSALGSSFTPNAYLAAAAMAIAQQQQAQQQHHQQQQQQQQQQAQQNMPSPSSTPGATSNDLLSKDLFARFNPAFAAAAAASAAAALPAMTPISPLSSAAAAAATMQRLLQQNSAAAGTAALFGKSLSELQKLQAEQQQQQQQLLATRYAALMKGVLAPSAGASSPSPSKEMDFYGDTPEQDGPIDLSMKRRLASLTEALNLSTPAQHMTIGDHDSGFSPSSNEDNIFHNQSASSFLAKLGVRQHRSKALDLTGMSANDSDEHVDVEIEDFDDDEHIDDDDDVDLEGVDSGSVDIDMSANGRKAVDSSKPSNPSSPKSNSDHRASQGPTHSVRRQEIECAP